MVKYLTGSDFACSRPERYKNNDGLTTNRSLTRIDYCAAEYVCGHFQVAVSHVQQAIKAGAFNSHVVIPR